MNFSIVNNVVLYCLILILFICVIILFDRSNKSKVIIQTSNSSNETDTLDTSNIPDELTLNKLKVKSLEIEDSLISPIIHTRNLYSLDKDERAPIIINSSLVMPNNRTVLNTPQVNTNGLDVRVVSGINNLRVNNGYIKKFLNDETITEEEFYNKTNEDKTNYQKTYNL